MKLFQQQTINHVLHLLATVFLCGLWLPFWVLVAVSDNQPWRCSFCGFSDSEKYLRDPHLRSQEKAASDLKARIRQERGDITFQETIAYFVSDNQPLLVRIGIAAGIIGLLVIALKVLSR